MIIVTSSLSKNSVLKMLSVHAKTKSQRFQITLVGNAFLRARLVWAIDLTKEVKLGFQIHPA